MNNTAAYLLLVGLACSGCSRDAYRDYLGLWERVEGGRGDWREVIEIKRDGETLLFSDNVLVEKDMLGRPKQPHVMEQREGRLSVSNGLSAFQLGLSEDQFLLFADRKYKHISEARLKEIRAEIAEAKRLAEQHRAQCSELEAQWKKDHASLARAHRGESEIVMAQRKEIDDGYRAKADKVPECRFVVAGW